MNKIALIVAHNYAELIREAYGVDEAAILQKAFMHIGAEVSLRSFGDPSVDWAEFDAVVPKAAWDYFHNPRDFVSWLDRLTANGVRSINDAGLIKWNHDKRYLADLREAGVRVAPFVYFPPGSDPAAVVSRLKAEGWNHAVIKPSISAGAWKTLSADLVQTPEIEALARDILGRSGLLVQPLYSLVKAGQHLAEKWSKSYGDAATSDN